MRAGSPPGRGSRGWLRAELDVVRAGELVRATCAAPDNADPANAYGHWDRSGRLRRVHASYSSGWRATVVVRADGNCSISWAIRLITGRAAAL